MDALQALVRSAYLATLLRRTFALWLLARIVLVVLGGLLGMANPALRPISLTLPPITSVLLVVIVAIMAQIDARIVREQLFHANLGVPANMPAWFAIVFVPVLEAATAFVAAVT